MRGKLELTARGRVTLLLIHLTGSAAWLTADATAQLATAALAAPFVVDLVYKMLFAPRVLARVGRRRTQAGHLFLEAIDLRNDGAHAHGLEFSEPVTSVRQGSAYVETLPRGAVAQIRLPARVRRRGIASKRAFELETRHPFGMLRRRMLLECPTELVAEPSRTKLEEDVLLRLHANDREPKAIGAATGAEFFALREYQTGEDARFVHARRSAGLGTLVSRDLRGGHNPEVAIVVDLRRAPGRGYHFGDRRIEVRLSLAATLLDELMRRQAQPRCYMIGGGLLRWTVDSQASAESFLNALAVAHAVPFRHLESDAFDDLPPETTSFWVPAGGHDARRDRRLLNDVVLVAEEAP